MDATHSVQFPGANNGVSGGDRTFVPLLAKAAIAAGANGLFIETHPNPERALSDAATQLPLECLEELVVSCLKIKRALIWRKYISPQAAKAENYYIILDWFAMHAICRASIWAVKIRHIAIYLARTEWVKTKKAQGDSALKKNISHWHKSPSHIRQDLAQYAHKAINTALGKAKNPSAKK